jgi:hypothetical protein
MAVTLDLIRNCFDGAIPSVIATCAPDGTPNAAYTSQVHFIDNSHVALSYQFFNKTRENILANPLATAQVVDPDTGQHYHLALRYLRTETSGPLFEKMKARLAGIASHTGMAKVFQLRGSDIYEVMRITQVPGSPLPKQPSRYNRITALRECVGQLSGDSDLGGMFDAILHALQTRFDMHHAMVLMLDESGQRLFTVASQGYVESGIGAEILLGEGVIGVAAQHRTVIRINHMAHEYLYSNTVREGLLRSQGARGLETGIPMPGLTESRSQLAVPILLRNTLFGVLYVESPQEQRFSHEDEDALVTLANYLALVIPMHEQGQEEHGTPHAAPRHAAVSGSHAVIRHYATDDSIFINDDYLIKGVAGAILWKLVREHRDHQRSEFCNRELRLDPSLGLPAVIENLEARLILLQRRLAERCPFVIIEKTGRGRFRLRVERPLQLSEA